ncbi:MAG: protein-L-isoaspartate(D-aspartate) O-methyltransferase [Candidatus Woesearchaeota archaeon]
MNTKQDLIKYWKENNICSDKIIKAFKKIKRENFIPKSLINEAYEDRPLSIGYNATISQPTTIIIMLQALELKKGDRILEIGTGSGYNAALIAELVKPGIVYSLEIIKELAKFAENNLKKANIKNIKIFNKDGSKGLKEYQPYNKIVFTAACKEIPYNLLDQLKENGISLAPVGLYQQKMLKLIKNKEGVEIQSLGDFLFVPLKQD